MTIPRLPVLALLLLALPLLPGCSSAPAGGAPARSAGLSPAPGPAARVLEGLRVAGRGPRTGYDRAAFGPAWADVDRNGCDTRNDVLRRDLTGTTLRAGTQGCVVLSGRLEDPYTGRSLSFSKADAAAMQIDHVVALSDAWQKGAAAWTDARRLQFANDPLELLAVDGPTNQAKGDGDAATWLPPARGYRCRYVARQVAVKQRYGLSVTAAERDAVRRVLTVCPGEPLPGGAAPVGAPAAGAAPVGAPAAGAPAATAPAGGTAAPVAAHAHPDYGSCAAARAAGAGPYRRGQVEYGYYRDADHDGTVCER